MAAVALLKFSQGLNVGADGLALKGVIGTAVNVQNSDNTGVVSWQIDLVYSDPASAVFPATPYAFNDNSNTPFAAFTPDVRGCYRFVLSVWDVPNRFGPPTSRDIRIFAVPEVHGLVAPPAQLWPRPLPVPASGETGNRPNEFNFDGQPDGWAGNGADDGLLNELVRRVDSTVSSARQEKLTVTLNGQTAFTLSAATTSDTTVVMYVNGVKQAYGIDYTASGADVTYLSAVPLQTTDVVEFWYIVGALSGGGSSSGYPVYKELAVSAIVGTTTNDTLITALQNVSGGTYRVSAHLISVGSDTELTGNVNVRVRANDADLVNSGTLEDVLNVISNGTAGQLITGTSVVEVPAGVDIGYSITLDPGACDMTANIYIEYLGA
jgi:hypothetical protein